MKTRKLIFKVYIEGKEIAFIGGNMSAQAGALSAASVIIPFSRYATQLRPRTIVTITYGYADDKDLNNQIREYVLFDGEMVSMRIGGNSSSKTCTLMLSSPLSALKRYRKYVQTNKSAPITSAAQLHLAPDNRGEKHIAIYSVKAAEVPGADSQSKRLLEVIGGDKPFPACLHDEIAEGIRANNINNTPTTVQVHEQLYGYLDSFAIIDMLDRDQEWADFRKSTNFTTFIQKLAFGGDGTSSADYYTFMVSLYNNFNFNLTDIGVPHLRTIEETSMENSVRYTLAPSSAFLSPPACNILLPDAILDSNISINYEHEITRASLVAPSVHTKGDTAYSAYLYPAPDSLFNEFDTEKALEFTVDSTQLDKAYGNNEWFLTPKGFYQVLPPFYSMLATDASFDKTRTYISKYANLFYLNRKYQEHRCTVSTVFNPSVVPGFTMAVLDQDQPYFAYVASVSHSFSPSSASTSIQGTHALTPLDYLNPDLRSANGVEKQISQREIGKQYLSQGFGPSFFDFCFSQTILSQTAQEKGDKDLSIELPSLIDSLLKELGAENRLEEKIILEKNKPDILKRLKEASGEKTNPKTSKIDEGIDRLTGLEIIMKRVREAGLSQDALVEYLRLNGGRKPVLAAKKRDNVAWKGDKHAYTRRGYWFDVTSSNPAFASLFIRRKVAEKLAEDINNRGTAPYLSKRVNIENSLVSLVSEEITPKTLSEEQGLDR
jgi:hypothetical protein